jgi:hypothetical protein
MQPNFRYKYVAVFAPSALVGDSPFRQARLGSQVRNRVLSGQRPTRKSGAAGKWLDIIAHEALTTPPQSIR